MTLKRKKISINNFLIEGAFGSIQLRGAELIISQVDLHNLTVPQNDKIPNHYIGPTKLLLPQLHFFC